MARIIKFEDFADNQNLKTLDQARADLEIDLLEGLHNIDINILTKPEIQSMLRTNGLGLVNQFVIFRNRDILPLAIHTSHKVAAYIVFNTKIEYSDYTEKEMIMRASRELISTSFHEKPNYQNLFHFLKTLYLLYENRCMILQQTELLEDQIPYIMLNIIKLILSKLTYNTNNIDNYSVSSSEF